jgi:hypothetical protein
LNVLGIFFPAQHVLQRNHSGEWWVMVVMMTIPRCARMTPQTLQLLHCEWGQGVQWGIDGGLNPPVTHLLLPASWVCHWLLILLKPSPRPLCNHTHFERRLSRIPAVDSCTVYNQTYNQSWFFVLKPLNVTFILFSSMSLVILPIIVLPRLINQFSNTCSTI